MQSIRVISDCSWSKISVIRTDGSSLILIGGSGSVKRLSLVSGENSAITRIWIGDPKNKIYFDRTYFLKIIFFQSSYLWGSFSSKVWKLELKEACRRTGQFFPLEHRDEQRSADKLGTWSSRAPSSGLIATSSEIRLQSGALWQSRLEPYEELRDYRKFCLIRVSTLTAYFW